MALEEPSLAAEVCVESVGDPRGRVVLIAADEYSIGRMLTGVLSRTGLAVVWPGGMVEAVDWLRENPGRAAAAFVDCHQTAGEGREFCLRAREATRGLPVYLAGGRDGLEVIAGLQSAGLTRHVQRPYLPTEVAWLLRDCLFAT